MRVLQCIPEINTCWSLYAQSQSRSNVIWVLDVAPYSSLWTIDFLCIFSVIRCTLWNCLCPICLSLLPTPRVPCTGLWRRNLRNCIFRPPPTIVLTGFLRSIGLLPLIKSLWRRLSNLSTRLWGGGIYSRLACYEQTTFLSRGINIFLC